MCPAKYHKHWRGIVVVVAVVSLVLLGLVLLLSRRSRQRERLHASVLSISSFVCLSVCLYVCRQNAKKRDFLKTKQFRAMVSIIDDL